MLSAAISRTSPRTLNAFHLIESALAQAQFEREQIDCLAIGIGPGSYFGIRAAIAIAQGWELTQPIRVLGISAVECLIAQAHLQGISGRVTVIIDAQRNEFYLTGYEIKADGPHLIEPLRLAAHSEAAARAQASELLIGPEVERWFPHGSTLFPDGAMLAKLAVGRADFITAEQLEPIYLRETNFVKAVPSRVY